MKRSRQHIADLELGSSREAAEAAVARTKEQDVLWDVPRRFGRRTSEDSETECSERSEDLASAES